MMLMLMKCNAIKEVKHLRCYSVGSEIILDAPDGSPR
jgi:hypothetical protein